MLRLKSFLHFYPLEIGVLAIGAFSVLHGAIDGLLTLIHFNLFGVLLDGIFILCALALIYAALKQHRHLVFPWMGVTIIFLITELIATLGFSLSAIIGFIVLAAIYLYGFLIVWSYYLELKDKGSGPA